ncbi:MAG: FtsX-like permease family protein [Candidatus Aenigmarchaeota archaeon]|nr:FtsX-like permease family protein [Candidatus Aminicenantes bacterium]NIN91627.1 FtsX-like permease family protein [bacterium]NIO19665.1 FtsX-like permease family protein [Candidatus Aenigmarchaeota archaeon]
MLKNYLKIALRNIRRYKGYSFINIAGLAIGMACCILILLWVQDELSYDRFHENADYIYRVIQDINFADHSTTWAITQGPLGPSLKEDFPEIINTTRITSRRFRLTYNDKSFDERPGMADGSIFEMFSFPLIKGDPATALSDPNSIVMTEETAKKYFGSEEPLGKTIKADNRWDFQVTGILKEVPHNSHLQFDYLIPFIFGRELNYTVDNWRNSQFRTYVQLQKGIPAQEVIQKISGYLDEKPTLEKDARLNLQPLVRIHLYSDYEFDAAHGDITYVTIFSIIAFFILLIACINFMNLATARSGNRAKEVGMRKVAGAHKTDIVRQFYGESIFLAFIALFVALTIVWLLLPTFNNLAAKELSMGVSGNLLVLLGLLSITLLTGIISGSYPALFLSAFKPVKILKGSLRSGSKGSIFRKILVVFQFALTILLIICTIIIYNQLNYMRNMKLGYDKEFLIYKGMRGDVRAKFDSVKNELLQNPNILGVTATSSEPTYGYTFSNSLWRWEGQDPDEETLMRAVFVDLDYFKTFGMEIVEGRNYSKEFPTDATEAIMVNEEAVKAMGMESPIGRRLSIGNNNFKIIGVVKNYHFRSLRQEIDPLILIYGPGQCRVLFARLRSENIPKTIGYMEDIWKEFAPGHPFNYRFLDDALNDLYRSEQRIGTILKYFSILAIFISCLGLFGLASFMSEQRTKEIGIRKVLGASVSNIALLLSREFTKWVLLANIIAWPVAYFAMYKWLQSYAYSTNIALWSFFLSGTMALVIATVAVSYQSIKAAVTNPADSLRYE